MNRRVRDLIRNNAQAKRILMALTDLVIGSGFNTYSWPFSSTEQLEAISEFETASEGRLGPRLRYALESDDWFDRWSSDPDQFDIEGQGAVQHGR